MQVWDTMDVWTGLSATLSNPLCDDDELGHVLQQAALARNACPKACVAALRQGLKTISDFTSKKFVFFFTSTARRRSGAACAHITSS